LDKDTIGDEENFFANAVTLVYDYVRTQAIPTDKAAIEAKIKELKALQAELAKLEKENADLDRQIDGLEQMLAVLAPLGYQ